MARHFDITAWTDFARDLVAGPARDAMQVHLDAGCDTCRQRVAVARTMVAFAEAEAGQVPPESAVRLARAIFPMASATSWRDLPRVIAQLVADTFAQPLPAGVRSSAVAPRHAVFEAGDYAIDVRVQRERDARDLWLVGQIQAQGDAPVAADAPVALFHDDALVAQTRSNEFGEFQIHYPAGRPGHLSVAVDNGQRRIDIDLGALVTRETKTSRRDDL